jgi:putative salt-induced outer membrane protein YdiY
MYEYEELDNAVYNRDHRLSSYLSLSYKMGKNISIINTTYNQPKLSNFKDYRIYSQTDIKMVFSKHFAFKVSYVYSFDTNPALNVPKIDQAFKNSISFEF